MTRDELDRLTKKINRLWRQLEGVSKQEAAKMKVTCTRGCSQCCYLKTMITFADALLIANYLFNKPDWRAFLPVLHDAAVLTMNEQGIPKDSTTYFLEQHPCVFLKNNECSIYNIRPITCRNFYSVTDPILCKYDTPPEKRAEQKSFSIAEVQLKAMAVSSEMGFPVPAPLPLGVLASFQDVIDVRGTPEDMALWKAAYGDLPSPVEWVERWMETPASETEGSTFIAALREGMKLRE